MQEGSLPGSQKHVRHNLLLLLPHCRDPARASWPALASSFSSVSHRHLLPDPKMICLQCFLLQTLPFPAKVGGNPSRVWGKVRAHGRNPVPWVNIVITGFGYSVTLLLKPIVFPLRLHEQWKQQQWLSPPRVCFAYPIFHTESPSPLFQNAGNWVYCQDMPSRWGTTWRWEWSSPIWRTPELTGNHWWGSSRKITFGAISGSVLAVAFSLNTDICFQTSLTAQTFPSWAL